MNNRAEKNKKQQKLLKRQEKNNLPGKGSGEK